MIIGAKISLHLTTLGYEVTAILPRGEEAIRHVEENAPDIILMDINLKGQLDGIETATIIQKFTKIPIIYLTANTDDGTFDRAKPTRPYAFISKPFKQLDVQRAIELTISRMAENQMGKIDAHETSEPTVLMPNFDDANATFIMSDRIFVKHKEKMVKVFIEDILYIEADRNYSKISTRNKEFLLATTLKIMEDKLPKQQFVRVHRSFLVNVKQIDEVSENHVIINQRAIPLSILMREDLLKRLRTI